jgi:mRNA-degrading endonuclease RelE of RelBE toxin-antitoxin system
MHPEYFELSFEDVTQDTMRKLEKRARKKRKKKSFKLCNNCIPLSEYSGNQNINCHYMIKRRELRYKFEIVNYDAKMFELIGSQ